MVALSLQYTAYKEMLLGFAGNTTMNVVGINQHGTGNGAEIIFAEPFPHRASEAYLFSPPGYWKNVYDNPLYPDDFPTDLKSSMSGGATTATIPGSYTDGHYLMLYNVWEVWRKIEVDIIDGKVYYVNGRDVSNLPENIDFMFGEDDGFWCEIDINSAILEEIDCDITIAISDGSEIDGELIVAVERESDMPSEMFVWNIAETDIDSEIWISATTDIASELTVKYDCQEDLDSELTIKYDCETEIDAEIFVWFLDGCNLDSEIWVYNHSSIDSEILVQQTDRKDLDSVINIQRTAVSDIDSKIIVYAYGTYWKRLLDTEILISKIEDSSIDAEVTAAALGVNELDSEIEILKSNVVMAIPVEMVVAIQVASEIDAEISIFSTSIMEAMADTQVSGNSYIGNELMITYASSFDMGTELIVVPRVQEMEAVVNTMTEAAFDLNTEIAVTACESVQIDSEINVQAHTGMEAVVDVKSGARKDLSSEMTVVGAGSSELDTELSVTSSNGMEVITDSKSGGNNDIDAAINICQIDESCIDVELMIVSGTMMEVIYDTHGSYRTEIDCELNVVITCVSDIDSEINVTSGAVMEAVVDLLHVERGDLDSEMMVTHLDISDLDSEISITSGTSLEAVTDLLGGGQYDVDSEICVAFIAESSIDCAMMVNATNRMETAVFYRNDIYADLDSEIAIAVNADLDSEIYVVYENDKTVMGISAYTMPAVLRTGTTTAIKDAVCYSYTALTNYGTLPELSVGRFTGGETFKGLIGFNLAELSIPHTDAMNYFGYETIQKVILKLYVTRPMVEDDVIIKVYRISDSWFETKVNYRALDSLPVYEQVAELIAPKKMGDIAIDITAGFIDWAHKSDRQSFMLVVENPLQATKKGIYFSSREGFKVPRLEVQYYRTLPNGYWNDLDSEVFVNPNANLDSEITIAAPNETALPCFIDIAMAGSATCDLEIDIEILANNIWSELLDSEIEIIGYPDETQLDSECSVMFWEKKATLDAELIVVRDPQGEAYMYIM
ncbi:DNRLRE domain-containing protein [Anaerospora hongkongensis]|uniref:DNRLRE domain-containing protein n=1 Tax=Anaerospora hongkongensis TaxID=244830 RepID=UPI0028A2251F|nr:DNRLRE domain-containing protein [Anaerospora hongkongensis]